MEEITLEELTEKKLIRSWVKKEVGSILRYPSNNGDIIRFLVTNRAVYVKSDLVRDILNCNGGTHFFVVPIPSIKDKYTMPLKEEYFIISILQKIEKKVSDHG